MSAAREQRLVGDEMKELTPQQKYSNALRAIADWYEEHPDAPTPHTGCQTLKVYSFDATPGEMRSIGTCKKVYEGSIFKCIVEGDGFDIHFVANRSDVCVPKVVGFREIPEQYVEAHVIPAKREEIIEWECRESLLNSEASA